MNNFGWALDQMRAGEKVRRAGWNGKGMWICQGEGRTVKAEHFWNVNTRTFAYTQPDSTVEVLPYLIMKTADNKILMGWLASQTDMLASDWELA